jgi:hypothetical protein
MQSVAALVETEVGNVNNSTVEWQFLRPASHKPLPLNSAEGYDGMISKLKDPSRWKKTKPTSAEVYILLEEPKVCPLSDLPHTYLIFTTIRNGSMHPPLLKQVQLLRLCFKVLPQIEWLRM